MTNFEINLKERAKTLKTPEEINAFFDGVKMGLQEAQRIYKGDNYDGPTSLDEIRASEGIN